MVYEVPTQIDIANAGTSIYHASKASQHKFLIVLITMNEIPEIRFMPTPDKTFARRSDDDRTRDPVRQTSRVDTVELFGGEREVILVHRGEQYRLRVTQNGKLILTK